ncbi:hypothetical protein KFZ03_25895, partial [Salmonella enterica subsp. enterica serovar 1,4,[5],12:i:-]|nr:hypothetical protein [Salmonella enterica subsp. enterica serovar 1,4,[5],12:i:-]
NTIKAEGGTAPYSVYPRWRGEHATRNGSKTLPCRFITAGAGNTGPMGPTSPSVAVYPRWRGEHVTLGKWKASNIGLSPLEPGTPTKCR